MKKQIIVSAFGAMLLASCADHFDQTFETVRPEKMAEYGYLEKYDALKEYIADKPNFHLGIGTTVDEYNKQELVYALTNSNFNETVAGNAMKMASCVADDGSMDFEKVKTYVKNATDAGLSVYGHTLAWHSQQPLKYLNGLIEGREIQVDPGAKVEKIDYDLDCSTLTGYSWTGAPATVKTEWNKDGAMVITNPSALAEWWTLQYWLVNGIALQPGKAYKVKIVCKAEGDADANIRFKLGDWGGGYEKTFIIPANDGYQDIEFTATPTMASNGLFFQHGDFAGKIYWKSMTIYHEETPVMEIPVTVGHLTFDDDNSLGGWGMDKAPTNVNGVCEVGNVTARANAWESQINYEPGFAFENGKNYHLKMKIKGTVAGSFGAGFQNPDGYKGCGDFPTIKFTTDWSEVDVATTCNGDNAKRLLLNIGKYVGTIYIDDFEVYYMKKANKIPLTDEEKKDTLTWAMNKWIDGMMEACDGKVKAWDVVNEALSGADSDGDGKYDLQSAARGNVSAEDAATCFYWQDYLGDLDYVRTAVKAAREGFAAHNGNPEDLKLFINDYNLESDWDGNGKLKSLIKWIHDWEADGVTKIDGIGSQMHISCYGDAKTQESKKNAIVNMLKLMAESGKLVRISELDMGYVDATGKTVNTTEMTEAQHKEMRELYEFIIKKYLEIIPEAQQWGICQWCPTDSPAGSGWRAGLPVGLWDKDYYRKHTYGDFAAGLGAPEYWNEATDK